MLNPMWTLRVRLVINVERNINMYELEGLLNDTPEHRERVRQGLRAYFHGVMAQEIIYNRESMLDRSDIEFDVQWDRMIKFHQKKMGRDPDAKM